MNQIVVVDCSRLLMFAAWYTCAAERNNKMFDLTKDIRVFKNKGWEKYHQQLLNSYHQKDTEVNFNNAVKQAYIGFNKLLQL